MRVCLMIEGQESVSWEDWLALARACDESPIDALFRSDHYLSVMGRGDRGSLDAWATIAGLAAVTSDLRLGTLVSPATFRHPSVLAKNVVTADHISGGGRIELGMGAGWLEAEHAAYGLPFPPVGERFELLEEQIEIVRRQWDEGPLEFEGDHYKLSGNALPKPLSPPNLIVGGRAQPRSLRLAAHWADEYNLVMMTADECAELAVFTQRAMTAVRAASGAHGFNIGMNQGAVAGAGIAAHLHQHVVPRWGGDSNFMAVTGRTRVLPQLLADTRKLLADAWPVSS